MTVTRFSLHQQWGHVGSELIRANNRIRLGDIAGYEKSIDRVFAMLNDMILDHKKRGRNVKELYLFRDGIFACCKKRTIIDVDYIRYCESFVRH
ncbi:MAG: hypothetical protein N3A54_05720 [Patescibacteria group bacterium]|nr:hypothetical protein [Patescibacteria group bacterium]